MRNRLVRHTPAVLRALINCEPDEVLPYVLGFLSRQIPTISPIDYASAIVDYRVTELDHWTMYEAIYHLSARSRTYLEIGTRRGWSLVVALSGNKELKCTSVDHYADFEYADEPNPGPALVSKEVQKVTTKASVDFVVANSHDVLPSIDRRFDLILVDGDHTVGGARRDVLDAWNLLNPQGWMVCDDFNFLLGKGLDLRDVLRERGARSICFSHYGNGTLLARKRAGRYILLDSTV